MWKLYNKTVLRGAVCSVIFVLAVLVTFAVIREIPGGIKYTVNRCQRKKCVKYLYNKICG